MASTEKDMWTVFEEEECGREKVEEEASKSRQPRRIYGEVTAA